MENKGCSQNKEFDAVINNIAKGISEIGEWNSNVREKIREIGGFEQNLSSTDDEKKSDQLSYIGRLKAEYEKIGALIIDIKTIDDNLNRLF